MNIFGVEVPLQALAGFISAMVAAVAALEARIAQSEAATGKIFSRFWCHGEFLQIDGTKMSKRLGNITTVKDLRERGVSAVALRHFIYSTHYRKQMNLSGTGLEASLEAVRRVVAQRAEPTPPSVKPASPDQPGDETIPVELGGVTTFVQRSHIIYAQAQGDYARLHTAKGSHLVRVSLNALEERWGDSGFVRIHRSTLVSTAQITAVTVQGGRCKVRLGEDIELEVSRRHTRALRDRLIRSANRPTGA